MKKDMKKDILKSLSIKFNEDEFLFTYIESSLRLLYDKHGIDQVAAVLADVNAALLTD